MGGVGCEGGGRGGGRKEDLLLVLEERHCDCDCGCEIRYSSTGVMGGGGACLGGSRERGGSWRGEEGHSGGGRGQKR